MFAENRKTVSVLMSGIGGYGYYYLKTLLEEFPAGAVELRGVVDPAPEKSGLLPELKRRKIPIYQTVEDFYHSGNSVDLTVISSPIHYHVPQSIAALKKGSHVLCDKPLAVTVQEAENLIRIKNTTGRSATAANKARQRIPAGEKKSLQENKFLAHNDAGYWVMIGYQWSFSTAVQNLKKDIMSGLFGRPKRLKTLCSWPRSHDYYNRNDWAGKKRDEKGWILDSPANNAMAHFLHNLFFLLGENISSSARPKEIAAEIYRAYPIENFDTAACRIFTDENTELLFYVSHATAADRGPMFNLEFEDAVVSFGEDSGEIVAKSHKGKEKTYGSPDRDHQFRKLFEAVETVKNPRPVVCGPEAAFSHTLCVNGIQESVNEIPDFPGSLIRENESKERLWVEGLDEVLFQCYRGGILPCEKKLPWAKAGKTISLENYHFFPL